MMRNLFFSSVNSVLSVVKKVVAIIFLAILCIFSPGSLHAQGRYPRTINISYIESPFNLQIMVMRERRMLENAFAPLGITVRWLPLNSGAEQTQAMAAGSLDIAPVINSTSVILANAAGNPVQAAALVSRPRQMFALMTGPNGPRTIRELRGKTVAGPKGSVPHQMLLAALAKEGVRASDVRIIQMGLAEARTALLSNRVDAAFQVESRIIRNEEAGMRTLITADGYLTPLLFTVVRPAFARDYPRLLQMYLDVQEEACNWIAANTAEAIAIGSRLRQISASEGTRLYQWSGIAKSMEESDIAALQADVDFLYQQDMIERKINPRDFLLPSVFGRNH
jgi:ABC-type nitrate/sulfonate/bicarbonate transport system substrate-binding protein